jgi:uncharacterized protein involved in outer membrane biogenesis
VAGGLTVATAEPVPDWKCDATLSGVDLGPVLSAATGKAPVSGPLSATANLTAKGSQPEALLATLAGPVSLRLENGLIHGFSMSPSLLASLKALVGLVELNPKALVTATGDFGQALATSHQGETRLALASAKFLFANGRGATKDILVVLPQAKVTGSGTVDLGQRRLDLGLLADVHEVGTVPLTAEGPLTAPSVTVDKAALAKRAITNLPRTLGKSIQDTGKSTLEHIKDFFGGATRP